jgi:hypothetical protein
MIKLFEILFNLLIQIIKHNSTSSKTLLSFYITLFKYLSFFIVLYLTENIKFTFNMIDWTNNLVSLQRIDSDSNLLTSLDH